MSDTDRLEGGKEGFHVGDYTVEAMRVDIIETVDEDEDRCGCPRAASR